MSSQSAGRPGLVSVILPTYNREQTLARAIRSVLNQTYRDLELIVVDDGSTDGTAALMKQFDDPRLRYHPLDRNRGASAARNVGLSLVQGEYIAFQDSDDEWLIDKLERQLDAAKAAGEPLVTVFHMKVVYGRDENRVYGPGRVCCVPIIEGPEAGRDYEKISHERNLISPQTVLFSRGVIALSGGFDELLVNSVDWDFSLRLVRHTKVIFLEEPLVMTYIQDDSISRLKRSGARSQLRIALKLAARPEVDPVVLSGHLGRVGMNLTRLGKPRFGARLLKRSLKLDPTDLKNWGRLAVTVVRGGSYARKGRGRTSIAGVS